MNEEEYRLGIDIGGTFTDLILHNEQTGDITSLKTPTIPNDTNQGIINGISLLKEKGINPANIKYFVHGTTIGLNTILQRKGAKIAFFVTEGFRDLLNLQRLRLPVPYDFRSRHPESLIPRQLVFPIKERLLYDGTVQTKLDVNSLDAAILAAKEAEVEGIVVSFLHSYLDPVHEQLAKKIINEKFPEVEVTLSSTLWPQMREYERSVMSVMNAYIQPKVQRSFTTLTERLSEEGVHTNPFITQSNGGIMDIHTAKDSPITTLYSGPAAGVIGAQQIAASADVSSVVTFDVGGTSADISIIENGEPSYTQFNSISGFPIMLPSISIFSIGAGGGSYAWIDNGGLLKVGPNSVGSSPGPACYGKGNKAALTDAFLLCGYLNPNEFAGEDIALDIQNAEKALKPISEHLSLDTDETADQMIQVAIANMYAEMSNVMEYQGFDPRDFSLLAFGGAGPVLANLLAEELQFKSIVIPPEPGTLSPMGALSANFVHDVVKSRQTLVNNDVMPNIKNDYAHLVKRANHWLSKQDALNIKDSQLFFTMDARYKNQAYEIELPVEPKYIENIDTDGIIKQFHELHHLRYGHHDPNVQVEVINLRVRIVGYLPKPITPELEKSDMLPIPTSYRDILIKGEKYYAPIYKRDELFASQVIEGPAIIEQGDTTVLIMNRWYSYVDNNGNLMIKRSKGKEE